MTLMQIQEFTFCSHHKRGLIVLQDVAQRLTLAFDVHPDEVPRLARIMKGSQQVVHPRRFRKRAYGLRASPTSRLHAQHTVLCP